MAKEGEEGAALSDVALHLTVSGLGGVGDGNEVGGGRAAERGREPAGGGRAAVRSRDRLGSNLIKSGFSGKVYPYGRQIFDRCFED